MTTIHDTTMMAEPAAVSPARAPGRIGVAVRIVELVVLFLGVPALFWLNIVPTRMFWSVLGGAAVYVCLVLTMDRTFRWRDAWRQRVSRREIVRVLGLWMIAVPVMILFTWAVDRHWIPLDTRQPRELLFGFPSRAPAFWAMVMVLYPVFSVMPQELIYRVFMFHRYEPILGSRWVMIVVSALAFAWAHILFQNWIAVALSGVLGLLIAISYARTRSAPIAWLEHALYGDAAFTIGLGWFFFTGSVSVQ